MIRSWVCISADGDVIHVDEPISCVHIIVRDLLHDLVSDGCEDVEILSWVNYDG